MTRDEHDRYITFVRQAYVVLICVIAMTAIAPLWAGAVIAIVSVLGAHVAAMLWCDHVPAKGGD